MSGSSARSSGAPPWPSSSKEKRFRGLQSRTVSHSLPLILGGGRRQEGSSGVGHVCTGPLSLPLRYFFFPLPSSNQSSLPLLAFPSLLPVHKEEISLTRLPHPLHLTQPVLTFFFKSLKLSTIFYTTCTYMYNV